MSVVQDKGVRCHLAGALRILLSLEPRSSPAAASILGATSQLRQALVVRISDILLFLARTADTTVTSALIAVHIRALGQLREGNSDCTLSLVMEGAGANSLGNVGVIEIATLAVVSEVVSDVCTSNDGGKGDVCKDLHFGLRKELVKSRQLKRI